MLLSKILRSVDKKTISKFRDISIKGIACNSKAVKDGFIFVAIEGFSQDGHKFIDEAISKGATVVVAQKNFEAPSAIIKVLTKDSRSALANMAAAFFNEPARKLKKTAITGTNGKTTVSYLLETIFKRNGIKTGLVGTIYYKIDDEFIEAKNTTPGSLELQELLAKMVLKKLTHLIMEVSSHSLDQGRVKNLDFDCAIFTNLTGDHLDYHKTMQGYFNAKAKLFESLTKDAAAVINTDDAYGRRLPQYTKARIITYGLKKGSYICAQDIRQSLKGTTFKLKMGKATTDIKTPLIGIHNVYNILAATAGALTADLSFSDIKRGIEALSLVPGRLERIDCGQPFELFIDYAHTDDALKNILSSLKAVSKKEIILVFGCGGQRDKTKRPRMGRVASRYADRMIITTDNPRNEEPLEIASDIASGIPENFKNFIIVLDRYEAIKAAIDCASRHSIVLIAGKGHENYQIFKDKKIEFDDRKVTKEILQEQEREWV